MYLRVCGYVCVIVCKGGNQGGREGIGGGECEYGVECVYKLDKKAVRPCAAVSSRVLQYLAVCDKVLQCVAVLAVDTRAHCPLLLVIFHK